MRSVLHVARVHWQHKDLVQNMIWREFRLRYLGSALGGYWNLLHPMAMIAIYTLVFSKVMSAKLGGMSDVPYAFPFFLCAGLLPWNAFLEIMSRGTTTFYDQANLLKKVSFPREILQTIVTGSASVTFFISVALLLCTMIVFDYGVGFSLVYFPVIVVLHLMFASSLGVILSILNVFFRDTAQAVQIVLQVWFWLTPIVYRFDHIPEHFQWLIRINPMYYSITMFQDVLFWKKTPQFDHMLMMAGGCAVLTLLGCVMLSRFKDDVIDEL
ncbi:MAG: ABC transporter permease [Oligoflexales bacterium]